MSRARTLVGRGGALTLAAALAAAWLVELALIHGPDALHPLRVALGIPLVLLAPGFVFARALFRPERSSWERWLLLTLGTSLAIDVCVGLVLNLFAPGLQATSWMIALAVVTVAGDLVSQALGRPMPLVRIRPMRWSWPLAAGMAVLLGLASAGYALSRHSFVTQRYPGFTQLWLLPEGHGRYQLGVADHEHQLARYSLSLAVVGKRRQTFDLGAVRPGTTWSQTVTIPGATPTAWAVLRRNGRAYRSVYLRPPCPIAGDQGVCPQSDLPAGR